MKIRSHFLRTAGGAMLVLVALLLTSAPALAQAAGPRNVILFIGDGMGFNQVEAASLYQTGATEGLSFQGKYSILYT